jgi:cytochrome c-type biogenesis protein CcmF
LALLTVAIGGAFLFYALYAPQVKSGEKFNIISRETTLLLNNVFLFTFCFTVFTGTLYPLFLSALNLGSVSVGPPYYTATMLPLLLPFALLMGMAPFMVWRETPLKSTLKKLRIPLVLMVILLGLIALSPVKDKPLSLLGFLTGGWIVATTGYDALRKTSYFKNPRTMPLSYYGMMFAHIGFGILLMGITATTLWKSEKILWMQAGDSVEIAGQQITFLGTNAGQGKNFNKITGVFTLGDNDTPYPVFMSPEKRWYPVTQKETSEVALHLSRFDIIYLVMGDQDASIVDKWVIRVYYHPLVLWILIGAMLIALGGGLSFFDRKRRHE